MKINWFLLIFAIIGGCQSPPKRPQRPALDLNWKQNEWSQTRQTPIEILVDPQSLDTLRLSEIGKQITLIKLESPSDHAIGKIDKVLKKGEHFYVLDAQQGKSVYIFDQNGTFVSQLNAQGKGPGEYIDPAYMSILNQENQLVIWDDKQHKSLFYDLNDNFLEAFFFPVFTREYACLGRDTHMFYFGNRKNPPELGDLAYKLIITNHKGEVRSKHFQQDQHIDMNIHFYSYYDSLNLVHTIGDTIYRITPTEIRAAYTINFGKYALPNSFVFNDVAKFEQLKSQNYAFLISHVCETSTHLFFTFVYRGKRKCVLFHKKSGHYGTFDCFWDDIHGGFRLINIFPLQDEIFIAINAYQLREKYNELKEKMAPDQWAKFAITYPDFVRIAKATSESDNPVLVGVRLKEL